MTNVPPPEGSLSVRAQFTTGLASASKAYNLPSIDNDTQELIQSALKDLQTVYRRIEALSLFSDNETLEDVSTQDLVYMFVPFVLAEVVGRVKTTEPDARIGRLREAERYLGRFGKLLEDYDVIPPDERKLFGNTQGAVNDPAKRRETKIAQFKKEKEIRGKIEALAKRRGREFKDSPTEFDLIASLLPRASSGDDDDEDEDEDVARELTLLLLRLTFGQALSQLQSMDQELELLRNAPGVSEARVTPPQRSVDDTWRLDNVVSGGPDGKGPLLDSQGKPLRNFVIHSNASQAAERARLQAQVFQPDHRLPTMTIDDYLEVERQRGNIISGGGPASQNAPTSSEQLAIDSEQDGTAFGEEKAEEKRRKDEEWARFTDANPKGSGNTMNRG